MSVAAKRKPDWTLCVKEGEKWREVGAAWNTERGNMFVRLDAPVAAGIGIMAFPYREKPQSRYAVRTWRPPAKPAQTAAAPPNPSQPPPAEHYANDFAEEDPSSPSWL